MFNLYTVVQKYIVKLLGPFGFQESGSLYFEHTNFSTIFHFFILVLIFISIVQLFLYIRKIMKRSYNFGLNEPGIVVVNAYCAYLYCNKTNNYSTCFFFIGLVLEDTKINRKNVIYI